jgi:uncharacterized protein (TIGR03086 family)
MASDIIDLLEHGYTWTADRLARVEPGDLDTPTPCEGWQLRHLLDHMLTSLERLAAAASAGGEAGGQGGGDGDGEGDGGETAVDRLGDDCGRAAFAAVRQRALAVWREPDVMGRTCALPLGMIPAPAAAHITLVEVVVHGWDVSQATGEAADIPPELAEPILEFSRQAVDPARGRAFGPDLGVGDTVAERAVAFLGRKP